MPIQDEVALAAGERENALLDLVKADYDATLRTMTGVLATGAGIRAAGFATWAGLLGIGLRDESWTLCALAAVIVGLFAYADAYHAAIYRAVLHRAITIESMLDRYLDRLGIDAEDDDAVQSAIAGLEVHRFGVYRTMRRVTGRELVKARPRPVFRGLYPTLLLAAASAAVVVGV